MNPSLGSFIRQRREELKLTQRTVALHVGFKSIAHFSDIEAGNRNPGADVLVKLAEILQVSVETLQDHDVRAPIQATKELLESRPEMVAAFRRVVNKAQTLSPEELLRRIENQDPKN